MSKRLVQGSAMLEVLIAALVVGFILLALIHFQGTLTQTNNYAKTRSLAVGLAQTKLDDLRSFSQLAGGGAGVFGYSEIGEDTGGREKGDGTLELPSGTQTVANVAYNLSWDCGERAYNTDTPPALDPLMGMDPDSCTTSTTTDFKEVDVLVTWLEPLTGVTESVTLNSVIHSDDPVADTMTIAESEKPRPFILYTPGAAPNFIPVPIAPGVSQESSMPEPEAARFNVSTLTTFDAVQYGDSSNDTLSRREFVNVSCTCEQAGTGTGRTPTLASLPDLYTRTDLQTGAGVNVTKRIGRTKRGGQLNQQPALCDICCRDHHDDSAVALKYDPFGGTPTGPSGDHDHYNRNASGVLVLANAINNTYLEVCRFQRVNGDLALAQDWKLENLVVLPEAFFTVAASRTDYGNYIDQFIRDYINGITVGSYPTTTPTPITVLPNAPTEMNITGNGVNVNTQARAIYIDYMPDAQITALQDLLDMDADAVILPYVPWFEVNVTRLANWSVGNTSRITVTNDPIMDGNETTYSRGRVRSVSGTAGTPTFVRATMERSNSGLTDTFVIDPGDAATTAKDLSVNVFATGMPPTTRRVTGTISFTGAVDDVVPSDVVVVGTSGASCNKPTQDTYVCNLTSTGNGAVSFQNFEGILLDTTTDPPTPIPPNQMCPAASFTYSAVPSTVVRDVLVIDGSEACP